jgi:hypothetical protein
MISMAEYYIIIDREEVGPETEKLIEIQCKCGRATLSGNGAWTITNVSEQDQKVWFAAFERAMSKDFPSPCDDCGYDHAECVCEPEPNVRDHRAGPGDQVNAESTPVAGSGASTCWADAQGKIP